MINCILSGMADGSQGGGDKRGSRKFHLASTPSRTSLTRVCLNIKNAWQRHRHLAAVALSWRGARAVAEEFRRRGSNGHEWILSLSRSTAPLVI